MFPLFGRVTRQTGYIVHLFRMYPFEPNLDMLLKTIRRKFRKSRSPSPENVWRRPPQEEVEREMALTMELRNILSTFQHHKPNTSARPILWSALLPLELIYLIIDLYYSDDSDLETLTALAGTCRILSSYCRKYIYRSVTVGTRTTTAINDISNPEKFARLVAQVPRILPHIQNFHITMYNRGRGAKFDPLNREEESVVFLLAQRMKKLRRLEITMGVDWILLPDRLQDAISNTFQSPTLNDVIIEGIRSFPLNLLLHVKNLDVLDFRCDAAPPSDQDGPPSFTVQPKMIHLHDPRASTIRYLFGERSSLSTSQLHGLSVFGNGRVVSTLAAYLPSFSTLTRLELDPGTLGGGACPKTLFFLSETKGLFSSWYLVPAVPDLGHLPILRYLTLTVDILVSLSVTLIGESIPRWQWVINTLNTCHKPSTIEEIHIVVHTNSPKHTQVYDWAALDAVFSVHSSWPALQVVDISICAEFDFFRGYLGTDFFHQFLPDRMVSLVRKGVKLRGRYSPRRFHGQHSCI